VKLKVEGMSCGHCSAKVAKTLEELNGVKKAEVDLESQSASVHLKNENSHTAEELAAVVTKIGYRATVQ